MSNLPILYFTLGMLAGLPLGYRMAAVWYEEMLPAWAVCAETWMVLVMLGEATRDTDAVIAKFSAAGLVPKAAA